MCAQGTYGGGRSYAPGCGAIGAVGGAVGGGLGTAGGRGGFGEIPLDLKYAITCPGISFIVSVANRWALESPCSNSDFVPRAERTTRTDRERGDGEHEGVSE